MPGYYWRSGLPIPTCAELVPEYWKKPGLTTPDWFCDFVPGPSRQ